MKPTFTCDLDRSIEFLNDTLAESDEAIFVEHLNDCDSCRQRVKELAAEDKTWDDVEQFLKDDAHDPILLANSDADSNGEANDHAGAQINHVLSVLAPTDDPSKLGRLGGYEVTGVVGSGGMGVVLKAHDNSLDRTVAMKVLAPHLASSGAARRRFAREAKATAAVLHPNVIAIHGVSNEAALPYLVMPYVRGESLQRRLDHQGPLEVNEILRIGQQIAAGLSAAHAQGLVHRDIKPANILLADGIERVTITDFGLARAVDDATMTRSGVVAGTPQYMSPEQARGEAIDARSDLFSLGSLMYAMCTGRPPFRAETSFGVMRRITDDSPRDISEINSNIPPWLCRLIQLLQEKSPEQRVQTAEQTEQILQQCIAHLEQPSAKSLPEILQPRKSLRSLIAGISASILCLTLIAMFWRPGEKSPAPDSLADQTATAISEAAGEAEASRSDDAVRPHWDDGIDQSILDTTEQIEALERSMQSDRLNPSG